MGFFRSRQRVWIMMAILRRCGRRRHASQWLKCLTDWSDLQFSRPIINFIVRREVNWCIWTRYDATSSEDECTSFWFHIQTNRSNWFAASFISLFPNQSYVTQHRGATDANDFTIRDSVISNQVDWNLIDDCFRRCLGCPTGFGGEQMHSRHDYVLIW